MPIRLESDVEKRVVRDATVQGWWCLKLVCVGHRGFPDRWFIRGSTQQGNPNPEIIIIEFKAPGKKARPIQSYVCGKLGKMGFEVHKEVDNYDRAMQILCPAPVSA